jgi:ferric-dicitrate binding protein FerR (iron transport regulator)
VTRPAELEELLAPLTEPVDELASRRLHVERDRVVARMVAASLAPPRRFGRPAQLIGALALAAAVTLAAWAGVTRWRSEPVGALQVVAVRGEVRSLGGPLALHSASRLSAAGTLETGVGAAARLQAPGGASIELAAETRVGLADLVPEGGAATLRLERGQVRCRVRHDPARTFTVLAGDTRVVDIGTVFSVSLESTPAGAVTHVVVEEGEVLVERAGVQQRLRAPASWSSAVPSPALAAPSAAPPRDEPVEIATPSSAVSARRAPSKPRVDTLALETRLLRAGLAQEQSGDLAGAARSLQTLTTRYPDSPLSLDARTALRRVQARLKAQDSR